MFGETTIFYVQVWNHPTETTILKWMFRVPGVCDFFFISPETAAKFGPLHKMQESYNTPLEHIPVRQL